MTRHSKNNTARGFFSNAERAELKYGTQKQRLGAESVRSFDACCLCLHKARTPVSCSKGHLYCRECILENILAQKKEIARMKEAVESHNKAVEEKAASVDKEKKAAEVAKFVKTESQFLPESSPGASKKTSTLPSFWIPSLVPEADQAKKDTKTQEPQCNATEEPHPISLKKLIEVKFTENKSSTPTDDPHKICPSCVKNFKNGSHLILLKGCGHVFCKECVVKFVRVSKKCMVCEEKCKDKEFIDLKAEGTGFSQGGRAQAVKSGPAFQ